MVWACLTLIQAWIAAGKPPGQEILASYESWSRVMGGILGAAGVEGFLGDRDEVKAATGDSEAPLRAFVEAWWNRFGSDEVRIGSLDRQTERPANLDAVADLIGLLYYRKGDIDLGFNHHQLASWQSGLGKMIAVAKDRVFVVDGAQVKVCHRRTNQGVRVQLDPMTP